MSFNIFFLFLIFSSLFSAIVKVVPLTSWNLSSSSFPTAVKVNVPSTIIGGLVEAKAPGYDFDPLYSKNLDRIDDAWFLVPWVYETAVEIDANDNEVVLLCFDGLNFKANVWVNNIQVGSKDDLKGPFRKFKLDVTHAVKKSFGVVNVRVELYRANDFCFPPGNNSTDLAISFVDWNPHPPDYSMGLIRPVYLQRLSSSETLPFALTIEGPVVKSELDKDLKTASLTVTYVVKNWEQTTIENPTFYADLGLPGVSLLEKTITQIKSGEFARVDFETIKVDIDDPQKMLWWPWQMGSPNMFTLTVGVSKASSKVAYLTTKYGIREMTSNLSSEGFRQFFVNGNFVLIRGAGWSPDIFLRDSQLRKQFMLVRDMNLNAIRSEGKMEFDLFWDLADEFGILMIPGWCCCDAWQHWPDWDDEVYFVAQESMRTQARRLAIHPSILAFFYSSDELPPPDVEKLYLDVLEEEHWPNPTVASASERTSDITGPTGVKMSGPYSWVPPVYWLEDTSKSHHLGGAYGFLTEGGPGEAPLTFRSWKRTIPEKYLWEEGKGSMSDWWSYHCANPVGLFRDLRFFTPALNARYGEGRSAEDYLYKAQAMSYEGIRAFYEGYARNRHDSATGLIQWMLNNAWPEHFWHLYDSYLSSGSGYYATKIANEPLHVMLSYTDGTVWIMNQVFESIESTISVKAEIIGIDGSVSWSKETSVSRLDEDSTVLLPIKVPLDGEGKYKKHDTFFVQLVWECQGNQWVNTYWLSPEMDELDWKNSNFYRTPCFKWADFLQLEKLKPVNLKTNITKGKGKVEVEILNPEDSETVAFFIEVIAMNSKTDVDVTPVFWTDNWFTLKPGDSRKVETVLPEGVESENVDIVVESWNEVVGKY